MHKIFFLKFLITAIRASENVFPSKNMDYDFLTANQKNKKTKVIIANCSSICTEGTFEEETVKVASRYFRYPALIGNLWSRSAIIKEGERNYKAVPVMRCFVLFFVFFVLVFFSSSSSFLFFLISFVKPWRLSCFFFWKILVTIDCSDDYRHNEILILAAFWLWRGHIQMKRCWSDQTLERLNATASHERT